MYLTRCCQLSSGLSLMPPKLHTKEQENARRKELYAKKMMAKAQPEARERELALKRMKQTQMRREYEKKVRDKQKAKRRF